MRVMNCNWSATKQRLHPQSVAEISRHSVLSGQDSTMWDIVWVSPQGHRSVPASRHFLLQAPQCPCSVQKRFSRDHCCRGRSVTLNDSHIFNDTEHGMACVQQLSFLCSRMWCAWMYPIEFMHVPHSRSSNCNINGVDLVHFAE